MKFFVIGLIGLLLAFCMGVQSQKSATPTLDQIRKELRTEALQSFQSQIEGEWKLEQQKAMSAFVRLTNTLPNEVLTLRPTGIDQGRYERNYVDDGVKFSGTYTLHVNQISDRALVTHVTFQSDRSVGNTIDYNLMPGSDTLTVLMVGNTQDLYRRLPDS